MPKLSDFSYDLPDERIAKYPLEDRSASKLLTYKNKSIKDHNFKEINDILSNKDCLIFNNTRVIPARLHFQKATGATIEIFLLSPVKPTEIVQLAMEVKGKASWKCMIGNVKKWKNDETLIKTIEINNEAIEISAKAIDLPNRIIELTWNDKHQFSDIVEALGKIPLPPYLNRDTELSDLTTYQTVYSKEKGAVAAPTAGLHFTDEVLKDLHTNNVDQQKLTLHVGAGTFLPVKHDNVLEHPMHNEQIVVSIDTIEYLATSDRNIIPVGTTSMRSLESLYWYGYLLSKGEDKFFIPKLLPYDDINTPITRKESFLYIHKHMKNNNLSTLIGETEIFIFPGYKFKVCTGLITNFHQPNSTLLMLISALIGDDWKKVYEHALANDYRFLSYGDSSILIP